jgi:hypothetical protein
MTLTWHVAVQKDIDMNTTGELRSAFNPEVLSSLESAMDDVLAELVADGVISDRDVDEARTRSAQKLMSFASSGRTVMQIRQLLSRALRNEHASRSRLSFS